jgi:hypothetical protein
MLDMQVSLLISTAEQAAAFKKVLDAWFPEQAQAAPPDPKKTAKEKLFAERKPEPIPLEQAIVAADAEVLKELGDGSPEPAAEPNADPFAALTAGTEQSAEVEAPTAEKKPRKNAKKSEPAAEPAEDRQAIAEKPLLLDDIRKASTIALELVGAPTIQEALAKFNAVDDRNVLRMSALRVADYALYVEYLKKKVNDAAKEWPAS